VLQHFDTAHHPLVVAVAPSGAGAASQIVPWYAEWDVVMAMGPHVVLIDLSQVDAVFVGARERSRVATEVNRRRDALRRTVRAEARLCPNPFVRGLMTAFDWLLGDPIGHPVAHFDDRAKAMAWLKQRAADAGLARVA
jgi:hypothetical protein